MKALKAVLSFLRRIFRRREAERARRNRPPSYGSAIKTASRRQICLAVFYDRWPKK